MLVLWLLIYFKETETSPDPYNEILIDKSKPNLTMKPQKQILTYELGDIIYFYIETFSIT